MVTARQPRPIPRRNPYRAERRKRVPIRRTFIARRRMLLIAGAAMAGIGLWAVLARHFAPTSNTGQTRFDAIVVLGSPADADGNPTPVQLSRVTEGVREYERDVAPRLIFAGGATGNRFVEAQVMARTAESQGVPASAIFLESQSRSTMENACNVVHLMQAHGWQSAEIVTSAQHLPRASLIFSRQPIQWRAHAAPPMEADADTVGGSAMETLKTVRYLLYASWADRCRS